MMYKIIEAVMINIKAGLGILLGSAVKEKSLGALIPKLGWDITV